jgi:hypothetical protein
VLELEHEPVPVPVQTPVPEHEPVPVPVQTKETKLAQIPKKDLVLGISAKGSSAWPLS